MNILPLSQLKVGQCGQVEDVTGESVYTQRLLEMGITKGAPIEMVRFAPLGDPINIRIRGYHLSLRKKEAEAIQVQIS